MDAILIAAIRSNDFSKVQELLSPNHIHHFIQNSNVESHGNNPINHFLHNSNVVESHNGNVESPPSINADIEASENDKECIICMTNKKQVVFNPCGHYNTCFECTDKIVKGDKKCPVCRKIIVTSIKVFE